MAKVRETSLARDIVSANDADLRPPARDRRMRVLLPATAENDEVEFSKGMMVGQSVGRNRGAQTGECRSGYLRVAFSLSEEVANPGAWEFPSAGHCGRLIQRPLPFVVLVQYLDSDEAVVLEVLR